MIHLALVILAIYIIFRFSAWLLSLFLNADRGAKSGCFMIAAGLFLLLLAHILF